MAKKKSKAQLKRMAKRAAERGEEYHYSPPNETKKLDEGSPSSHHDAYTPNELETRRLEVIAEKVEKDLRTIQADKELNAKDRRSAARKSEAIAAEEAGMSTTEWRDWYDKNYKAKSTTSTVDETKQQSDSDADGTDKLEELAKQLEIDLQTIQDDTTLKSKERRSAIRKAEAIAAEKGSMTASDLRKWYKEHLKAKPSTKSDEKVMEAVSLEGKKRNPYIAFIGQLSYETTADGLLKHIQEKLNEDFKVTSDMVQIRILTDPKTKKSRGMAFVEVNDPELLYGLLKLHQTFLDGRRINVERSAGGKKNSEKRKSKIAQYRKDQENYFDEVVDKMLLEYKSTGELRDDELDSGVIALMKRHSGTVVGAALAKYIEGSGRDMDNPSAYLTFLIGKFATEGVHEPRTGTDKKGSNKRRQAGTAGFAKKFKR